MEKKRSVSQRKGSQRRPGLAPRPLYPYQTPCQLPALAPHPPVLSRLTRGFERWSGLRGSVPVPACSCWFRSCSISHRSSAPSGRLLFSLSTRLSGSAGEDMALCQSRLPAPSQPSSPAPQTTQTPHLQGSQHRAVPEAAGAAVGSGAGAGSPAVHTPPAGGGASNHGAHASRCGHPPALTLRRQPASRQAELGHQLAVRPWPQLDHSEPLFPCFPSCLEGSELPPSNDLTLSQGIPALLRRTLKWGILPCPQRSGDPPWGLGRPHSASVSLSAPGTLSSCQSAKVALGVLPGRRDIGEEGSKRCSQGGSSGKESAC